MRNTKVRRTTTTPRKIIRLDVAALSLVQWKVQMATNHQMCVRFMQERPYISAHSEAHPLNQAGLSPEAKVHYYMALNFKNLKDPKLGLTDKITFGKFKDCRVCDIIKDHYEYLIWAEKQRFVKFQQDVTNLILEQAHFEKGVEPVKVSTDTFMKPTGSYVFDESDWEDDIPW